MQSPFVHTRPLVLASTSPRRQAFLREQGLEFTIVAPQLPEPDPQPGEIPDDYAKRTATAKAREALALVKARALPGLSSGPGPVILSADTIVVLDDGVPGHPATILGKPVSEEHAVDMLARLSGRTHTVITACCLLPASGLEDDQTYCFADHSLVTFAAWPVGLLRAYAATGDPLDKAGAYGIQGQGSFLVERIDGSWSTIVGLPMSRTMEALLKIGALRLR